jgi:hypothetical protein
MSNCLDLLLNPKQTVEKTTVCPARPVRRGCKCLYEFPDVIMK